MNTSGFTSANCYGRNAMLAQPVLHKIAMEEKSAAATVAPAPSKTDCTRQLLSKDLLERKMELHEQATESSSPKAKDKLIRIWQHIISQSPAPASGRGASGLMRR